MLSLTNDVVSWMQQTYSVHEILVLAWVSSINNSSMDCINFSLYSLF